MKSILSRSLSVLLATSIFFSSGPMPFTRAIAQAQTQNSGEAPRTGETDADRAEKIAQTLNTIAAPNKSTAELDTFLVLNQRTVDDRPDNLEALEKQMSIEDFNDRNTFYENEIKGLQESAAKNNVKLQAAQNQAQANPTAENMGAVEDATKIASDIQSRISLFQLEIEDLKQFDPRNGKALPVEFMIDKDIKKRHYWGNNLQVHLENKKGETVAVLQQKAFSTSLSPNFSAENPLEKMNSNEEITFTLRNPKGEIMNQFMIPVEGVLFFGQYLVFIEKNSDQGPKKVRFIDLNYFKPNIGNAPLAVYTLPLTEVDSTKDFRLEKGQLFVGQQPLIHAQFAMLGQLQQLIFNVQVALADPKTYENVQPLIEEINEFLKKSMAHQDKSFNEQFEKVLGGADFIKGLTDGLQNRPQIKSAEIKSMFEEALKDGKVSQAEYDKIKVVLNAQTEIQSANAGLGDAKKLTARMELLMHYLAQPRPQGAPKLFESLVLLAVSDQATRSKTWDLNKNSLYGKLIKYGAATAGLVVAGSFLPEPYTVNLYNTLDLISAVSSHFQGYLKHMEYGKAFVNLGKDAFVTSTTGFTYFYQSYFANGNWPKFLFGLGNVLLVPLKVFASIHITTNSYKLLKATVNIRNLSNGELGFIEAFKKAAQADQKAYWDSLAAAEKKVSGSNASELNAEDKRLLEEHLERLRSGREESDVLEKEIASGKMKTKKGLATLLKSLGGFVKLSKFGKKTEENFEKTAAQMGVKSDTLRSALASTFMSYSSLRSTFKTNATIWNYLFITRSYVFSPSKWFMFLLYPNYFNVTVTTREGKQHFPSHFNSGLEMWPQKLRKTVSAAVSKTPLRESSFAKNFLISKESLSALRAFENYMIPMEEAAMEIAKRKAQKALVESVQDPARLLALFDSTSLDGKTAATGIRDLNDPKFSELTSSEKLFYRAYFTRSFDLIMQGMVSQTHSIDQGMSMDPETFIKKVKADILSGALEPVQVEEAQIKAMERDLDKIIDFESVRTWSQQVGSEFSKFGEKVDINFRHKLLQSIHPGNRQISRFLTSKKKVEDPRAMERAMRMEVSSMLTSIPMGIVSTLALYAGVKTGILVPFDPGGMDTETHLMYMSRYLFYNGFIPGILISLMANTWMKVQTDARIDELGGFDKAVKFTDARKGFWRYYLTNFTKNPSNKWADNHKHMLRLITSNIPAAAVTIIASNLYGLGRIDLGSFIGTYALCYVLFLSGLNTKMDQAMELSSAWVASKIPRKLRAAPEAQRYINLELQKKKNVYSFYEHIYQTFFEHSMLGEMFVMKDNVQYGTRAFERLLFGGQTSTEIAVNFAERISKAFNAIPGVETAMDKLQFLISNNYEAFERFPANLGTPDAVKAAMENTGLPKHLLGEFIGKATAMIASMGSVAAMPYILAELHQRKESKKLQVEGAKAAAQLRLSGPSCSGVFAN